MTQLNAAVTKEQISDLKNQLGFGGKQFIPNEYIKDFKPNNIYSFIRHDEYFQQININFVSLHRLEKISKLLGESENVDRIKSELKVFEDVAVTMYEVLEKTLTKNLSDSINNDIIKKIMKLK